MRTERHETVKADFDDITGEFASIKPQNVLFYSAKYNFVVFTKIFFLAITFETQTLDSRSRALKTRIITNILFFWP